MIVTDPATFVLAASLVGPALALLLAAAHADPDNDVVAVRLWIAGDLLQALSRIVYLVQPQALGPDYAGLTGLTPTAAFIGNTCLVVAAGTVHTLALAQLVHCRPISGSSLALCVLLPTVYLVGAVLPNDGEPRSWWLLGFLSGLSVTALWVIAPLVRKSRGMVMLAGLFVITLVYSAWVATRPAESIGSVVAADAPLFPPFGIQVIDLMVPVLMTMCFMLTLQERMRSRIQQLSITDPLTGLLNRRGVLPQLERELRRAARHGRPLSIALLDLDHFKRINDSLGHASGDDALVGFAQRLTTQARQSDLLARWGGEEFLIALPETGRTQAIAVLERIRLAVAQAPLAPQLPVITVSCGIADSVGRQVDLNAMIDAADRALYLAKRQRNQVVADGDATKDPLASAGAAGPG